VEGVEFGKFLFQTPDLRIVGCFLVQEVVFDCRQLKFIAFLFKIGV
jgi:hypothetical protein